MTWQNDLFETSDAQLSVTGCFLCTPDPSLVYLESPRFIAMLALGPLGEGYSLIASREHVASMFDLDTGARRELDTFTDLIRATLRPHYGPVLITEHGRVAPCVSLTVRAYEPHCLHAHRLIFPGVATFDLALHAPWLAVSAFSDHGAAASAHQSGQYLYAEAERSECQVATVSGPFPRQFFRRVMATAAGSPHLADWSAYPGWSLIEAARARLCE